jgi:acyl carrier protein
VGRRRAATQAGNERPSRITRSEQRDSQGALAGLNSDGATAVERELATLIIAALRLAISVDDFDAAAPLYGEPLGLDSIDMLEIALAVSKRYGFEIRSEDVENERIFASLRDLARHVEAHRTV